MENTESRINEFIHLVKKEYDDINIGYSFNKDDDLYGIWHTYSLYYSEEFRKVIGKYIRTCFFDNDIFNISIAYDMNKDSEIKKKYTSFQNMVQPINISFKMPEKKQEGEYNIKRDNCFVGIDRNIKINNPKQQVLLINMKTVVYEVTLEAA